MHVRMRMLGSFRSCSFVCTLFTRFGVRCTKRIEHRRCRSTQLTGVGIGAPRRRQQVCTLKPRPHTARARACVLVLRSVCQQAVVLRATPPISTMTTTLLLAAAVATTMLLAGMGASASSPIAAPSNLRIEGLQADVAVLSEKMPLFSFTPPPAPAGSFGITQQSYRITVSKADAPNGKAVGKPLWDSGDVASTKTLALYVSRQ